MICSVCPGSMLGIIIDFDATRKRNAFLKFRFKPKPRLDSPDLIASDSCD